MALEIKNFKSPDEVTEFPKGKAELVALDGGSIGYTILQPGWSWREHIQPIVGGEWCQVRHEGYQISGRLHVKMATGEEMDIGPGDVAVMPPGHEGWVVGDEPAVGVDWSGAENFGRRPH